MTAELRRAVPEDFPAIAELLGQVFPANPKADPDVLRWQYLDGPAGPASSWVWEEDERIVSHFTMLLHPARVDGQAVLVGKSADAATLPDHRGRGYFPGAVEASLADLRERGGVGAIFSPSNPTSRRSLERLGMAAVAAPARVMARVSLRRLRRDPAAAPVGRDVLTTGEAELLSAAADRCHAAVDRTPAWVAWRFSRPGAAYLVGRAGHDATAGVAIGLVRPRGRLQALYVLDLAGTSKGARRRALRDLVARAVARVEGPLATVAVAGTCPEQIYELASSGLYRVPPRLSPGGFTFGLIAFDGPDDFPLAKRPWRLSWADLDHV